MSFTEMEKLGGRVSFRKKFKDFGSIEVPI